MPPYLDEEHLSKNIMQYNDVIDKLRVGRYRELEIFCKVRVGTDVQENGTFSDEIRCT